MQRCGSQAADPQPCSTGQRMSVNQAVVSMCTYSLRSFSVYSKTFLNQLVYQLILLF
jgi:hypothetical protein